MKTRNVQSIVCLGILFLSANWAWAEDWVLYNTSKEGKMYYDKSSVEKIGQDIVRVVTKTILNEKGKTEAFSFLQNKGVAPCNRDTVSYELTIEQYDCVNDKYKNVSTAIYDKKNKVLLGQKAIVGKWSDINPKSIAGKLKNTVCSIDTTIEGKKK